MPPKRLHSLALGTIAAASALAAFGVMPIESTALAQSGIEGAVVAPEKLRGELSEVLEGTLPDTKVRVTVIMKDQLERDIIQGVLTAGMTKSERRHFVTTALKDVAARSQGDLVAYLEGEQANGNVGDHIRQLWIHNVIGVEATPDVIRMIAARDDVDYVNWDKPMGEEVLLGMQGDPPGIAAVECGVDLMDADRVWSDFGITGDGVVVGVVDTGMCLTHPDIQNQVWTNPGETPGNNIDDDNNGFIDDINGWNFESNNNDVNDQWGHGSHVSGTVAGDGASGTQCGMAPDAQIMTCKFWNSFSGEQTVWDGMQYAVDNGGDIITASLGWPHSQNPDRVTWRNVCENSIAAGLVVIYAAGNEGCGNPPDNVRTPGDVPDVLTIGATDCNDNLAGFSSCGPITWEGIQPFDDCPYPPGCIKPDVSAPGVSTTSHNFCSGYTQLSGTSMATPHVAGAVALMLAANPNLDHFQVKDILESTAVDLGQSGRDNQYGSGRVDAYEAVAEAIRLRSCMALRVDNLVANETATFTVTNNITQGDTVMLAYGTGGNGTNYNENGYCATFGFDFDPQNQILAEGVVDANNEFVANVDMPYFWANQEIMFQAAKRDTCPDECMSHVLTRTVGGPPECMNLQVDNLVAGQTATFTLTENIVRGDYVAILWGTGGAPETINALDYCATFWFDLPGNPNSRVVGKGYVDQNDEFIKQVNVPANLSGMDIIFQGTKRGTCPDECMSNFVDTTIQ